MHLILNFLGFYFELFVLWMDEGKGMDPGTRINGLFHGENL